MATPNLNLVLPTVSVTLGPQWASELNAALTLIDAHDHTSGKGIPIRTAALDIDADLSLQDFRLQDASSLQLVTDAAPVSGVGFEHSLSVSLGNLYYTNGSGVAVQITSGGSVISPTAVLNELPYNAIAVDLIIGAADPYVVLAVNTGAPRTITLPAASAVNDGRFYVIKDATSQSETNTLTIAAAGADTIDGLSMATITSNGGSILVISNGTNAWNIW
jgi:hypothetical protein